MILPLVGSLLNLHRAFIHHEQLRREAMPHARLEEVGADAVAPLADGVVLQQRGVY
ncbi:hypothetical protein GTP81_29290 [Rugamonas sp. FT107W]|uniref:Uncharacterized protein n=1 Tax=Duganella vulcania TaxID=2692166 RepID=A0A845HTL2_9BURK|nr:hypothetical protein [Duganella vulcania]MYN20835.1 hypothetical protein [Duganella vulcania]